MNKNKFGRKPLLISTGERKKLQDEFRLLYPDDFSEEDVFDFVKNNPFAWERIEYFLRNVLESMFKSEPDCLTREDYSWGMSFNPFYVRVCLVGDFIRAIINPRRGVEGDAARLLGDYIATEWGFEKGVTVSRRVRLFG